MVGLKMILAEIWERVKTFLKWAFMIGIPVVGIAYGILSIINAILSGESSSEDTFTSSSTSYETDYAWNAGKNTWEKDGVEAKYRVTWRDVEDDGKEIHVRNFKDIDNGYEFFKDVQKTAGLYGATWDHVYEE